MRASRVQQPNLLWQKTRNMMVKVLAAVYVGGAYGLILVSLVQVYILVSWLKG